MRFDHNIKSPEMVVYNFADVPMSECECGHMRIIAMDLECWNAGNRKQTIAEAFADLSLAANKFRDETIKAVSSIRLFRKGK